jgi:hypothetical protein
VPCFLSVSTDVVTLVDTATDGDGAPVLTEKALAAAESPAPSEHHLTSQSSPTSAESASPSPTLTERSSATVSDAAFALPSPFASHAPLTKPVPARLFIPKPSYILDQSSPTTLSSSTPSPSYHRPPPRESSLFPNVIIDSASTSATAFSAPSLYSADETVVGRDTIYSTDSTAFETPSVYTTTGTPGISRFSTYTTSDTSTLAPSIYSETTVGPLSVYSEDGTAFSPSSNDHGTPGFSRFSTYTTDAETVVATSPDQPETPRVRQPELLRVPQREDVRHSTSSSVTLTSEWNTRASMHSETTFVDPSAPSQRSSPIDTTFSSNGPPTPTAPQYGYTDGGDHFATSDRKRKPFSYASGVTDADDVFTPGASGYGSPATPVAAPPLRRLRLQDFEATLESLSSEGEREPLPTYMLRAALGESTLARGPRRPYRTAPHVDPTLADAPLPVITSEPIPTPTRRRLQLRRRHGSIPVVEPPTYTQAARESMADDMPPMDDMDAAMEAAGVPMEMRRRWGYALFKAFFTRSRGMSAASMDDMAMDMDMDMDMVMDMMSEGMRTPTSSTSWRPSLVRSLSSNFPWLLRARRSGSTLARSTSTSTLARTPTSTQSDADARSVMTRATTPISEDFALDGSDGMLTPVPLDTTYTDMVGLPSVEAVAGRPLLHNGHLLVYPEGHECEMCSCLSPALLIYLHADHCSTQVAIPASWRIAGTLTTTNIAS